MRLLRLVVLRKRHLALLLFCLVAGAVALIYSGLAPSVAVTGRQERLVPIYYVDTAEKKIAISFDASWGAEYTPVLLKILQENGLKTTFFLTGFWVEKYPELVKEIAAAGHEIGNHTATHPHLNSLSPEQIASELEGVQKMIRELVGPTSDLFRPPFGEYSDKVVRTVERCGYRCIQWSVDSLDWQEVGKEAIVSRVNERLHPGAIVLFHNNGRYTAEALPEILAYAKENGYAIVPISELLYKNNYYVDGNTGAQIQKPKR